MVNDPNHPDPLFDDEPQTMVGRLLPPLVLICAFGGFVALAIYAYKAGTQSVADGELMVVEADKTPMKEKPEDPGGMQFPNQDKTIFETISGGNPPPKVERVLPTPEEPITTAETPEGKWVNDKLAGAAATPAATVTAEQVFGDEDTPPAKAEPVVVTAPPVETKVKNVQEELGKQAVADPVVVTTTVAPASEKKPVAKPVAKPKGLVQLGAYKSEAEAKGDFAKIQKKNALLAGKAPTINRADLGEKGIFYRLRVSTDDAKGLCAALSSAGQACMVVK